MKKYYQAKLVIMCGMYEKGFDDETFDKYKHKNDEKHFYSSSCKFRI